jgi:hypothetical protein
LNLIKIRRRYLGRIYFANIHNILNRSNAGNRGGGGGGDDDDDDDDDEMCICRENTL